MSVTLPGAAGMDRMRAIMATLRAQPPQSLGGLNVVRVRDYATLTSSTPGSAAVPLAGSQGDLVMFDLVASPAENPAAHRLEAGRFPAVGNCVAARPSGTEPKIKFYLFAVSPPCQASQLASAKTILADRLDALERDLRRLAGV